MLDIISQNGTQKMQLLHYFMSKTPNCEEETYSIYAVIVNLDTIEIARYQKEAIALKIFKTMVSFEREGRMFRLPLDKESSIKASLSGELFE